jgi:D-sedoheptulose 7-phosphate isomerase
MRREIQALFAESIAAKQRFVREHAATLERVVQLTADALRSGKKLLLFGNGGSAADAQHIAAEFVNRYEMERPPLPAIALTTDTSALTSIANDFAYADVFAKQVEALGRAGDVAYATSTSGNSPSVVRAVETCRRLGIHTVGLTGGSGGKLGKIVEHHLCVSGTTRTARIQETHILIGHVICDLVDRILFGDLRDRATAVAARPAARRAMRGPSRSVRPR